MILKKIYGYLIDNEYNTTLNKSDNYDNVIIFSDTELLDIYFENDKVDYYYVDKRKLKPYKITEGFAILSILICIFISTFCLINAYAEKTKVVDNVDSFILEKIVKEGFSGYSLGEGAKNYHIINDTVSDKKATTVVLEY